MLFRSLDPEEIVAIDFNSSQIFLCNLKKCALKRLNYREYLIFLGIEDGDSLALYNDLRNYLDEQTRSYFDERIYLIDKVKIVNLGRFEYYFCVFKNNNPIHHMILGLIILLYGWNYFFFPVINLIWCRIYEGKYEELITLPGYPDFDELKIYFISKEEAELIETAAEKLYNIL